MSLTENELALATWADDGGGCAISTAPEQPATVIIQWSEIRYYRATVLLTELAGAIRAAGPESGGHPLPANLRELEGDPFSHGDLNGLLCNLEPDGLTDVDGIEVTWITKGK